MKKLIITENQCELVENFLLFEANNTNSADRRQQLEELTKELKTRIANSAKRARIGSVIAFTFGLLDNKTGQRIPDKDVTYITVKTRNEPDELYLYLVSVIGTSRAAKKLPINIDMSIVYQSSVILGVRCKLKVLIITDIESEHPDKKETVINNLLDMVIYPNILNYKRANPTIPLNRKEIDAAVAKRKKIETTVQKGNDEAVGRYNETATKIIKDAQYTPALFGMNNFFFFPKGYGMMNKILQSYGMRVPTGNKEGGTELKPGEVEFRIISDAIKGANNTNLLKPKTRYVGVLNRKLLYITVKHEEGIIVLKYTGDIERGKEIEVESVFMANGVTNINNGISLNNTKIMIDNI